MKINIITESRRGATMKKYDQNCVDKKRYWYKYLSGAPCYIDLNPYRKRSINLSTVYKELSSSEELIFGDNNNFDNEQIFLKLQCAIAVFLSIITDSKDIVLGIISKNDRPDKSFFAARFNIELENSVSFLVAQAKEAELNAQNTGLLDCDSVASSLGVFPPSGVNPIFQVLCIKTKDPTPDFADFPNGLDLIIDYEPHSKNINLNLFYNSLVVDEKFVISMARIISKITILMVRTPETSVDKICREVLPQCSVMSTAQKSKKTLEQNLEEALAWYPLNNSQRDIWLSEQASRDVQKTNYVAATLRLPNNVNHSNLMTAMQEVIWSSEFAFLKISEDGVQSRHRECRINISSIDVITKLQWQQITFEEIQKWHISRTEDGDGRGDFTLFFGSGVAPILAFRCSHLYLDGWSVVRLFDDVCKNYDKIQSHGFPLILPKNTFLSEIRHDQLLRYSPKIEDGLVFWKKYFEKNATDIPLIEKLADYPQYIGQSGDIKSVHVKLNIQLIERLRVVSAKLGVTLNALLSSLTGMYLLKMSGQREITIAEAGLGRERKQINVKGCFSNVIPFIVEASPEDKLRDLIQKHCSSNKLIHTHGINCFGEFNKTLNLNNRYQEVCVNVLISSKAISINGCELFWSPVSGQRSDITFFYSNVGRNQPFELLVDYNESVFCEKTIALHCRYLTSFLQNVHENLDKPFAEIYIINNNQYDLITNRFNNTGCDIPNDYNIVNLLTQLSEKNENSIAIRHGGKDIQYKELFEKSNSLSVYLRNCGVVTDSIVAICTDRSIDLILFVISVLKAGGAFLLLDPDLPIQRIEYIVNDARPNYLFANHKLKEIFENKKLKNVIKISIEEAKRDYLNLDNFCVDFVNSITPENLAYVMYTSGSTGQPKGVMITHAALRNFLWASQQDFDLKSVDRILLSSSVLFDVFVEQVLLGIVYRCCLLMVNPKEISDKNYIQRIINEYKPSFIHATPTLWQELKNSKLPFQSISCAISGGEVINREVMQFMRSISDKSFNTYGPTESTITVTGVEISEETQPANIGGPIHNTQAYVVGARL
ncbi:AMP-binding protein, partial [Roseibium sp. RKSG952]|uniref:AMP-binding protein n=1 Tax=Roseibium sp. RKSG952 TaxID=2529384 RepID=UPI0012BC683B